MESSSLFLPFSERPNLSEHLEYPSLKKDSSEYSSSVKKDSSKSPSEEYPSSLKKGLSTNKNYLSVKKSFSGDTSNPSSNPSSNLELSLLYNELLRELCDSDLNALIKMCEGNDLFKDDFSASTSSPSTFLKPILLEHPSQHNLLLDYSEENLVFILNTFDALDLFDQKYSNIIRIVVKNYRHPLTFGEFAHYAIEACLVRKCFQTYSMEYCIDTISTLGNIEMLTVVLNNPDVNLKPLVLIASESAAKANQLNVVVFLSESSELDFNLIAKTGARYGHINIVKWAHSKESQLNTDSVLFNACLSDNYEIIEWMYSKKTPSNEEILELSDYAFRFQCLKVFTFLTKYTEQYDLLALLAISRSSFFTLKYSLMQGITNAEELIYKAFSETKIECLDVLVNYFDLNLNSLAKDAAEIGNLSVLKYAKNKGIDVSSFRSDHYNVQFWLEENTDYIMD